MQRRIDDLNKQLEPIIDRLRGYPAFDVAGYKQLEAQQLHLQNEIEWLTGIRKSIPMHIEGDSYSELSFDQIQIRLTFAPTTIVSPLNKWMYDLDDSRAARMEVINIDRMGYAFAYSREIVGKTPSERIAAEINHQYIHSAPKLGDMIQGVYFANIALRYLEMANQGVPMFMYGDMDTSLSDAANLARIPENLHEQIFDKAVIGDDYLKQLSASAGKDWPMARKVAIFALSQNRFNVDWQPFSV